MKAGRELNDLIVEKVMGVMWQPFQPSTDIADAWLVREWLINNVGGVRLERLCDADKPELCEVWDGAKYIRVQAETTPLAICLAALKSVDNVNIVDKGR